MQAWGKCMRTFTWPLVNKSSPFLSQGTCILAKLAMFPNSNSRRLLQFLSGDFPQIPDFLQNPWIVSPSGLRHSHSTDPGEGLWRCGWQLFQAVSCWRRRRFSLLRPETSEDGAVFLELADLCSVLTTQIPALSNCSFSSPLQCRLFRETRCCLVWCVWHVSHKPPFHGTDLLALELSHLLEVKPARSFQSKVAIHYSWRWTFQMTNDADHLLLCSGPSMCFFSEVAIHFLWSF